jgi:hypothetical protein
MHNYYRTFADFYRVVGREPFRIGFGLIAYTEPEAQELLEAAGKFLSDMGIRHPKRSVSVWWCGIRRELDVRRLV